MTRAPAAARRGPWLTVAALCVAALAFALMQTLVAPALPAIQAELSTSTTAVSWVLTVHLLTSSVATPLLGRLGDIFGKHLMVRAVMVVFAVGSAICALSESIGWLVAGRAIQGLAGATYPLAFGIIRDELPPERVPMGIGLVSGMYGIGGSAGLVISGPIVDGLGFDMLFWLGLAGALAAVVVTWRYVPASPARRRVTVDWLGAALLGSALAVFLLGVSQVGLSGWVLWPSGALLALGSALLYAWGRVELRVREPLVDMRMMREPTVLAANLTAVLTGVGMFSAFIIVPLFVQAPLSSGYGFGASVTEAGLFMLPSALVVLVAAPLAGVLGARRGFRFPLVLGLTICAAGFCLLAVLHHQRWQIYAGTALQGFGIGMSFSAMANLVVAAVPASQTGVAGGMNTIMRMVGGSLGTQVTASILAGNLLPGTTTPTELAFSAAFGFSAVAVAVAALIGLTLPRGARARDAAGRLRADGAVP